MQCSTLPTACYREFKHYPCIHSFCTRNRTRFYLIVASCASFSSQRSYCIDFVLLHANSVPQFVFRMVLRCFITKQNRMQMAAEHLRLSELVLNVFSMQQLFISLLIVCHAQNIVMLFK